MNKNDFLHQILRIKDVALATISLDGKPSNRIMDMMYLEEDCLFFLTARGKNLYKELELNPNVSITVCKNKKAYSLSGIVKKVNQSYLKKLFDNNTFMYKIYPNDTKEVLEVFKIDLWQGEFFDLTRKPIFRQSFTKTNQKNAFGKYQIILDKCIGCGSCLKSCPQKCIDIKDKVILEKHCLNCGACYEICKEGAIRIYE